MTPSIVFFSAVITLWLKTYSTVSHLKQTKCNKIHIAEYDENEIIK